MHSVLSGLFIPTLPLPNLHISIHVALLQSEISQTTFLSFIDFFITRTECHMKFPYFQNKISVFLSFCLNLNLRRLIQRKKLKHSPQIVSPVHCHTYHGQHLFLTVVTRFYIATSRSNASTSLCYLSQHSKPETL